MARETADLEPKAALGYVNYFFSLEKPEQLSEVSKGAREDERFVSVVGSDRPKERALVFSPPTFLENLRGRAGRLIVDLAKEWESVAASGMGLACLSPIYNSDFWWKSGLAVLGAGAVLGGVNWVSGRLILKD